MFIFAVLLTKTIEMLKELFETKLPAYYEQVSKKETHVYMSNVNKVLDATKDRLRRLKAINIEEGNYEVAEGLHIALCEIAFITSEVMLEQLKTTTNV